MVPSERPAATAPSPLVDAPVPESVPHVRLNVAVLGSTGSVGTNTLEVIAASGGRFGCHLLAAHRSVGPLLEQARRFRPAWLVVVDEAAAATISPADIPPGTRLAVGPAALDELVTGPEVDRVVSAIVGAAGLRSTWAALDAGKTVALANKETLVTAGPLVMRLAARRRASLLPVDSEHAAIHQALRAGQPGEVRRLILTASGGPFRGHSAVALAEVTPAEALRHPTWSMGPKITIDSATMMNKALELIEARWLFDMPAEKLEVVVHPQSVVHSLVEFVDGSLVAQLGPPDMKMPIQYALSFPQRFPGPARRLDFCNPLTLHFEPPDPERFPAVRLGQEAAARGGTSGAVLNAANEEAVRAFLDGRLRFTDIAMLCGRLLREHPFQPDPTLDDILRLDAWARQEVASWVGR
ncbi:MAG: 1-deoxy-D-xylulose-5-phosphate reductoisomerase [Planctomycetia bacterium]|nr:1-deoxy-D-xylulose-5-phosphate reductoisomerase [Planctomycetia bacterium]